MQQEGLRVNLISETMLPFGSLDYVVEQKSPTDRKLLKIKGPFLIAEQRNGNGRLYRRSCLERAVADYYRDYITPCRALGELGHPDRYEPVFEESCIKIESIKQLEDDPNIFWGEATVIASDPNHGIKGTGPGDALAAVLQYGIKPGVSSRGLGHMSADKIIESYYKLCAVDVVYTPSGPGCYVDGILESKDFLINTHGEVVELAFESFEQKLNKLPNHDRIEHLKNAFNSFINDIKTVK